MPDLLPELAKVLSIFGLSFFSFWPAMPAGLLLGLHPLVVIATTTLSYSAGVAVVILPGGRVRAWITRRWGTKAAGDSNGLLRRAWDRYGLAGLGLLGPMTVGAQIGALLGLSLNAPPRRLFLWMALGALLWSVALTLAVLLGVLGVQQVTG